MQVGAKALALAAVLTMGGCVSDANPADALPTLETDGSPPAAADPDAAGARPTLRLGDWWQYTVKYNSGQTFDARIIVVAQDSNHYHLSSDSRALLQRAIFSHYPTFGPVSRATLNHVIHGVEVPMFKFPMKNQTWEAPYRDFTGVYESRYTTLATDKGEVPGFTTTMRHKGDGKVRFVHSWSPVTKYYTQFAWDFDGSTPMEVEYTLRDWGSNHTGTVPILDFTEGVHRGFPAVGLGTTPPSTTQPDARASFTVPDKASLLFGMFANSGGPGDFELKLALAGSAPQAGTFPWRPAGAANHFQSHEITGNAGGQWNLVAAGAAQGSAFLFVEAYGVTARSIELAPAST